MKLEMLQKHKNLATWPKTAKIQLNELKWYKAVQNEPKGYFGRERECPYRLFQGPSSPLFNDGNFIK